MEVRFDDHGLKRVELYQVKDHHVVPGECKDVINAFMSKNIQSPGTYARFILACRSLGREAESLRQALEELRGAYPMYGPEDEILEGTKRDVKKSTRDWIDLPLDFLRQKVFFDTDLGDMKSDERLGEQFIGSIVRRIPKWATVGGLGLTSAYRDIAHLINISIRQTCSRDLLEQRIQLAIDSSPTRLDKEGVTVRLYHWEDPSFDLSQKWDVLLDWSEHFDRLSRKVPPPALWHDRFIPVWNKPRDGFVPVRAQDSFVFGRVLACRRVCFGLGVWRSEGIYL